MDLLNIYFRPFLREFPFPLCPIHEFKELDTVLNAETGLRRIPFYQYRQCQMQKEKPFWGLESCYVMKYSETIYNEGKNLLDEARSRHTSERAQTYLFVF